MLLRYVFPVGYQKPVLPWKAYNTDFWQAIEKEQSYFFLLLFTNPYYFEKEKETIFIG